MPSTNIQLPSTRFIPKAEDVVKQYTPLQQDQGYISIRVMLDQHFQDPAYADLWRSVSQTLSGSGKDQVIMRWVQDLYQSIKGQVGSFFLHSAWLRCH